MVTAKGTIVVTGTNGGLGSAIVAHILKAPALASDYVGVYTVRNAAAASQLQSVLKGSPLTHEHEMLELDLSSLEHVRKQAAYINDAVQRGKLPPIRALILNAGYQDGTRVVMSSDGFEMTWQVNYLANFLLSLLLLQSMDRQNGRILIIGSWSHDVDDKRNELGGNRPYEGKWRNLFPGPEALAKGEWSTTEQDSSPYTGFRRYGASKLCVIMFMNELSARISRDPGLAKVAVIGLDPGGMGTGITRRKGFVDGFLLPKVVVRLLAPVYVALNPNAPLRPLWKSASDVVRACFEVDCSQVKALYLNGTEELVTAVDARDEAKRRSLWRYSVETTAFEGTETELRDWR